MRLPIKELCQLALRAMETGNFIPFGGLLFLVYLTWPMTTSERLQVVQTVVDSRWFACAGWTAFGISLFFHRYVTNFRERKTDETIGRLQTERDGVVKKQLELPFKQGDTSTR